MKPKFPPLKELRKLCVDVKKDIEDDFRAYEDDDEPGILLTVGSDGRGGWSYQTGDTQYMGSAYGYPHWGQAAVRRDSDCTELARQIRDEIEDSYYTAILLNQERIVEVRRERLK